MTIQRNAVGDIEGRQIRLRLVQPDDAAYIHGLRTDPRYNTHLSPVTGTADDQRAWLERYKDREAAGLEFYFIVERLDGQRCGTLRLYGIEGGRFTWGSWILDENKPFKAALESAFLLYRTAFDMLGLELAQFDVRLENAKTLAFHRRLGARETGADSVNVYFEYSQADYVRDRDMPPGSFHAVFGGGRS